MRRHDDLRRRFGFGFAYKLAMLKAALYLRVSTDEQSVENQRPELEALAARRHMQIVSTYAETVSGVARRLPQLDLLMREAQRGRFDAILVWALDRIGRTMWEAVGRFVELDRLGVHVLSAKEPWIDTAGPAKSLLVCAFLWVAEQERTRLIERTHAGLARARTAGKRLGRPPVVVKLAELHKLKAAGLSAPAIAGRLGCSPSSVLRLLRRDRKEHSP
jgi:putative DNA-invertase from lambdoid prophage Rac